MFQVATVNAFWVTMANKWEFVSLRVTYGIAQNLDLKQTVKIINNYVYCTLLLVKYSECFVIRNYSECWVRWSCARSG